MHFYTQGDMVGFFLGGLGMGLLVGVLAVLATAGAVIEAWKRNAARWKEKATQETDKKGR